MHFHLLCGNGALDPGEECDDGNTVDGDGCTVDCLNVEAGWSCPTPGDLFVNLTECGDGIISGAEQCDDGAVVDLDGCSADCTLEAGWVCFFPGAPCVSACGDGMVTGAEQCDDGGDANDDGCSADCHWEDGWACTGAAGAYSCHETTCGDGTQEGTEGCDDGNVVPGDGCDVGCQLEPSCAPGEGCTSACGDGLVISPETCDDGNLVDGDGCSSSCTVEPGFTCSNDAPCETIDGTCVMRVPIVYRDFIGSDYGGHPDFQVGCGGNQATTGLVPDTLVNGLPVFDGQGRASCISDATSFSQWFDFSLTGTTFSEPLPSEMLLWDNGAGGYVNRYGDNGERWPVYTNVQACGTDDCSGCALAGAEVCIDPCIPLGTEAACQGEVVETLDGNPLFYPVDADEIAGTITPVDQYMSPEVPDPVYSGNWQVLPWETHNVGFTSRIRYWFTYTEDANFTLSFTGDDDMWAFVNGMLAVDLGGVHMPDEGSVTISATTAATYNLQAGRVYDITLFQAERRGPGSTYKLTLSGFNSTSSVCVPVCGDGVVTPGEECDNGVDANIGGYGNCNPDCTRGEYCGDGEVNGDEACDDGRNTSAYALEATDGCSPGCVLPPYCGDREVQSNAGEQCDDGVNSGAYGTCDEECQRAPWCGDAIVQTDAGEECDDGRNDGTYNTCSPDCALPPRCGDGELQEEYGEQCDLGAENGAGSGCSDNCKLEGICGDAILQDGEECDDGSNLGGYGLCAPGCVYGPRCGDGVVQSDYEDCDDGANEGGYGECAPGCVYGPHCGDEIVQDLYEECDDGPEGSTICTPACRRTGFVE